MQRRLACCGDDESHAAASRAQVNGVHQKQDKALVTEGEMGRFTKEDIGYLAMKQVSEGKVRAPLRTTSTRTRLEHSLRCGADGPTGPDATPRHATPCHATLPSRVERHRAAAPAAESEAAAREPTRVGCAA